MTLRRKSKEQSKEKSENPVYKVDQIIERRMLEEVDKEKHEKASIAQDDEGKLSTNDGFSNYTTELQFNSPPLANANDKRDPRCLF